MAKARKHRNLGPRRKRLRRPARLRAAIEWRSGYGGKNVVRGYARWFGVDLMCAIAELRLLGVPVDSGYEQQIRFTLAARSQARSRRRAAKLGATSVRAHVSPEDWPEEWFPPDIDDESLDTVPF